MTTTIPDFPDVEKCFGEFLGHLVASPDRIGNFVIEDFEAQGFDNIDDDDALFITLARRGGPTDIATFTDYPILEVSCWGKSRSVAVDGASAVLRAVLLDTLGEQFVAGGALFDGVEDVTGSEEDPLENSDERCVTRTFQLECRPMFD